MVIPSNAMLAGLNLTAKALATLPRKMQAGQSVTAFTKFVVVGHGEQAMEPAAISFGDDVCGGPGFTDKEAAHFLRTTVKSKLGSMAPQMVNCRLHPGSCPERSSPSVEQPLPWLSALSGHSLVGNALPVMIQSQSPELGIAVGDALSMLTASGGAWEAERVLYVFGADFGCRHGNNFASAKRCDEHMLDVLTGQGVPQSVKYFADLWAGKANKGDCGSESLPRSYASLLAAARTASGLGLKDTHYEVSNIAAPKQIVGAAVEGESLDGGIVGGFGSIMFWKDSGLPGEKLAAQQPPASLLARGVGAGPGQALRARGATA